MNKILLGCIEHLLANNQNIFIGISGISCSGKSYLSWELEKHFENNDITVSVIHQDEFFKDLNDIKANDFNCESKNCFHMDEVFRCIYELDTFGHTKYFKYDLQSNTRTNKLICQDKSRINIIEGLHAIDILNQYKLINDKTSIFTVYLDIDKNETLQRRINRDSKLCGITPELITSVYNSVILQYKPYEIQKNCANLVLKN